MSTTTNTEGHKKTAATARSASVRKMMIIAVFIIAAFLGSYNFASARSGAGALTGNLKAASAGYGQPGGGGGCCGSGGAPVDGATTIEGDIQRIAVDTSSGSFDPNVIKAKAGVPIEIAFSQAPGGCLSGVYFPDFNINEDLTGGGKTIKLPALAAGQYTFYCQMQMVSATIVVE